MYNRPIVENISTPALALSIQLSPCGPTKTPASIRPITLGTFKRLRRIGAKNIINNNIAKTKIGLAKGKDIFIIRLVITQLINIKTLFYYFVFTKIEKIICNIDLTHFFVAHKLIIFAS